MSAGVLLQIDNELDEKPTHAVTCPRCGSSNVNHLGNGYCECCTCGHGWGAW